MSPIDLEDLFERHGPFLRRLARVLVLDEHAAEDLVADTWTAAVSRPPAKLADERSWLSTVLRRRAISLQRRDGLRRPASYESEVTDDPSTVPGSDEMLQRLEHERLLHAAVTGLKEPYRSTVFLRFHEGLAPRQIAAQLGVPAKTVRTRLSRALGQLRASLDASFDDHDDPRKAWGVALLPIAGLSQLELTAATSVAAPIAVTITMKKFVPLAVLVAVALLGGWAALSGPARQRPDAGATLTEAATLARSTEDDTEVRELAAPRAEALVRDVAKSASARETTAGGTIQVTVRDIGGAAIGDRCVLIERWRFDGGQDWFSAQRTNAAGVVRFTGLRPARYIVHDGRGAATDGAQFTGDEEVAFEWTVEHSVTVRGQVVEASGAPAAGAEIWCCPSDKIPSRPWRCLVTGPDGRFELSGRVGMMIQATRRGFLSSDLFKVANLEETEPGIRSATLTLGGTATELSGRVVDALGRAIEGAVVVAGPNGMWRTVGVAGLTPVAVPVRTDAQGRFDYPAGIPEGEQPVTAVVAGHAAARTSVIASGRPIEIEIVIEAGAIVNGHVWMPDGRPAKGARVTMNQPDDARSGRQQVPWQTVATDEHGAYTLSDVSPGRAVFVEVKSAWPEPVSSASVLLIPMSGETITQDLTLDLGRTIRGRVVDAEGAPVPGVRISAKNAFVQADVRAISADDGSFCIGSLPKVPEPHDAWDMRAIVWTGAGMRLLARRDGVLSESVDVEFVVERVAPASAYVIGRFSSEDDRLPRDLVAMLWEEGQTSGLELTLDLDSGDFRVGPIAAGSYRLDLSRNGEFAGGRAGIRVGAGETVDLGVVMLGLGGHVEIEPKTSGMDWTDAETLQRIYSETRLILLGPNGMGTKLVWLGGVWRTDEQLAPGSWRIHLESNRLVATAQQVLVVEGETVRADLELEAGREVSVRLRMPAAASWSEVAVAVRLADGRALNYPVSVRRDTLEDETFYSIECNVPPGPIVIEVTTDGDVGVTKEVVTPELAAPFRKIEIDLAGS